MIFENGGQWVDGEYLLGAYQWPYDVTLGDAILDCQPPSVGAFSVQMELAGVPQAEAFSVPASAARIKLTQTFNLTVPANTMVRWRISADPGIEGNASAGAITLAVTPAGISQTAAPANLYQVIHRSGPAAGLVVFNYDPATAVFTPTAEAAGLVSITGARLNGASAAINLAVDGGVTRVLAAAAGRIQANSFFEMGGVATSEAPRLEFMINGARIATLSKLGCLRTATITENADILDLTDPAEGFAFYSAGQLTALLTPSGLIAAACAEMT